MDPSSGSDNIRVNLLFAARGIEKVSSQLKSLRTQMVQLERMQSRGLAGQVGANAGSISRQAADYRRLRTDALAATKAANAYSTTSRIGVEKAGKSLAQFRADVKAFKKEQYDVGTAIVGNPASFSMARRNFRNLSSNLKDSNKAGIATANSMRTLEDGLARTGGRGFTSMERLRVQAFALKKDFSVVGTKVMDMGKQMSWLGRNMMMNITLPLATFAATASREFLKVQNQFFQLQKVMEFGAEAGESKGVTKAKLGERFSGLKSEIISLSEELGQSQAVITGVFRDVAALGFSNEKLITGWSRGIAEIAAIGDIDLSVATEFFRTTNAIFTTGTQASKLEQTNELMAQFNAIADETSLQLKDLADAFPEVAPVMQKMGFGAAEIASSLAGAFKAGIPATEMAHALKFGFQRLVGPTKDASIAINDLGIEFFDAAGNVGGIGQARQAILQMAQSLDGLSDKQYGDVLGDIVGNRQTARWGLFVKSVLEGEEQLAKAMEDRKLDLEELQEINSDYMRGMLASGQIQRDYAEQVKQGKAEPGMDFSVLETAEARFRLAMDMYKEDPATQWNIMLTTLKNALIKFGEVIVPVITRWGDKVGDVAKWFSELPEGLIKAAGGVAAFASALGAVIVGFGAIKSIGGAAIKTMSFLVPRLGVRDIMPKQAMDLLAASPGRQDIGKIGNRTVQFKRGALPASASLLTGSAGAESVKKMMKKGEADSSLKKMNKTIAGTQKNIAKYGSTGIEANKKLTASTKEATKALSSARTEVHKAALAQHEYENAIAKRKKLEKSISKRHFLPGKMGVDAARSASDLEIEATRKAARATAGRASDATAAATLAATRQAKAADKAMAKEARRAARSARFNGASWAEGFRSGAEKPIQKSGNIFRRTLGSVVRPFSGVKSAAQTATGAIVNGFDRSKEAIALATSAAADNIRTSQRAAKAATDVARASAATASELGARAAVNAGQFVPGGGRAGPAAAAAGAAAAVDAKAARSAKMGSFFTKLKEPMKAMGKSIGGVTKAFGAMGVVAMVAGVKIMLIIGAIIAVIGVLAVVFGGAIKVITKNWDKIKERIAQPIQALKDAIGRIKEALEGIGNTIMGTIADVLFGGGALGGDKALADSTLWEKAAAVIGAVVDGLASAFNWIANAIEFTYPFFRNLANIVGSAVGFIGKLFTGDLVGALKYFVKFLYQLVQPVMWILEKIVEGFLWMAEQVARALRWTAQKTISLLKKIPGYDFIANLPGIREVKDWASNFVDSAVESLGGIRAQDWTGGLGRAIDDWLESSKFQLNFEGNINEDQIEDEAGDAGDVASDALANPMNEALGDVGKGSGQKIADNILADFLSILKPRVRKQMDELRAEMEASFKASSDAKLKVFDDQIQSINDIEKAEQDLFETQQYLEQKRELLDKKRIDLENYRRNRALAIYEGRISDVRQLDLEYVVTNKENNKNLNDLENSRQNDLIKKAREAAKKKIEIEREAEEERIRILEEAFKKQLDIIMEYEPRTVGEFDEMIGKLKNLAGQFAVAWPQAGRDGSYYFLTAIDQANNEIIKTFGWGGEAAVMAWVKQFIDAFALGILEMKNAITDGGNQLAEARDAALSNAGIGDSDNGRRKKGSLDEWKMWFQQQEQNMIDNQHLILAAGPSHPLYKMLTEQIAKTYREDSRTRRNNVLPSEMSQGQKDLLKVLLAQNLAPTYGSGVAGFSAGRVLLGNNVVQSVNSEINNSSNSSESAVKEWIGRSIIDTAKRKLEIKSPSQVFYRIGVDTISGFNDGIGSRPMWNFVKATIANKINEIAGDFGLIGSRITQSLGPLGAQMSLWFTMELSVAGATVADGINRILIKFMNFASRVIDSTGSFGPQMSLWFTREMTTAGRSIDSGVRGWLSKFLGFSAKAIQAIGPLGIQLSQFFQRSLNTANAVLPVLVNLLLNNFNNFGVRAIDRMRGFGSLISGFISMEMSLVRSNAAMQIDLVASEFSNFGQKIVNAITGSVNATSGDFGQLGKTMFNSLLRFINEKIIKTLRDFTIPFPVAAIGGERPFAGLRDLMPIYHKGGIVGSQYGGGREVMAMLQSGEGVLPLSAMKKIGRPAFELLRRGMIGDAVAMAASGAVKASMPRVPSMSMQRSADSTSNMPSGDVYISVDTFIGQEQWFKEMASKYDMKVSARAAKNNGSQKRVVSSYNQNERNTYR